MPVRCGRIIGVVEEADHFLVKAIWINGYTANKTVSSIGSFIEIRGSSQRPGNCFLLTN